ncbi:hypothetical protein N9X28_00480 [Candidatus Poseidoniales archaeon]|nr:hypothetical protein [Candidatus Poseidoniales archaeon]
MTISDKEKLPEQEEGTLDPEEIVQDPLNSESLILSLIEYANQGVEIDDEEDFDDYSVTYPESKVTEMRDIGANLGEDQETFVEEVESDLIDKLAEVLNSILAKKILIKLNEQNEEDIATIKGIEDKIRLSLMNGTNINHEQFFEDLSALNPELEFEEAMIQQLVEEINRIVPTGEEDGENAGDGN